MTAQMGPVAIDCPNCRQPVAWGGDTCDCGYQTRRRGVVAGVVGALAYGLWRWLR